jgi:hypothetical protein
MEASCVSSVVRTSAMRRAFASLRSRSWLFRVSDSVFCSRVSCCAKASIWVFCVRVASAPCLTSASWNVASVCVSSSRAPRDDSLISRRS